MARLYTITPVPTVRLTTVETVLATVPAGKRWIVRTVVIVQLGVSGTRGRMSCFGVGGGKRLIDQAIPQNETRVFDLRVSMAAGDSIRGSSSINDAVNLTVTCYEFDE